MGKPTVHVTPHHWGWWQVKVSWASKASHLSETKAESYAYGRERAIKLGTELVIHGKDWRIDDKNSYGRDPFPPIG